MLATGCAPRAAAPALASGEKPTTGVPRYDRLFNDIHSSLLAVQEARSEEVDARGALARRLGLPDAVSIEALGVRLRERTERLAREGLTLELEFTGIDDVDGLEPHGDGVDDGAAGDASAAAEGESATPTATLRTPGREPQRRELRLLEALAQAALSGATIYSNMGRERRRMERQLAEVGELEGRVDSTFVDPADRERVRRKLAEAKEFLPQLNSQAREISGAADILISLLDEAANTAPIGVGRRRVPGPAKDGAPRPAASGAATAAPGAAPPRATSTAAPANAPGTAAPASPADTSPAAAEPKPRSTP